MKTCRSAASLECELAVLACITGFATSRSATRIACALVGVATMSAPLPDDPSLPGQQFHHQVVARELDATGALVALHASNALSLTVGAF